MGNAKGDLSGFQLSYDLTGFLFFGKSKRHFFLAQSQAAVKVLFDGAVKLLITNRRIVKIRYRFMQHLCGEIRQFALKAAKSQTGIIEILFALRFLQANGSVGVVYIGGAVVLLGLGVLTFYACGYLLKGILIVSKKTWLFIKSCFVKKEG